MNSSNRPHTARTRDRMPSTQDARETLKLRTATISVGSYIHGPLGRVILEKIRAGGFQPGNAILLFIAEHAAVIVPDGLTFPVEVMAPIVIPFPVLLRKLPGHKWIRGLEIFPQRKAPAIVKQNRLPDHIALIAFQSSTSLKSGHFGTDCPKVPQRKC